LKLREMANDNPAFEPNLEDRHMAPIPASVEYRGRPDLIELTMVSDAWIAEFQRQVVRLDAARLASSTEAQREFHRPQIRAARRSHNGVCGFVGAMARAEGCAGRAPRGTAFVFQHREVCAECDVAPIHDRMPALFTCEAEWDAWLHPDAAPEELRKMLAQADNDLLETFPVTRELLRSEEPGPELLAPMAP